MKGRRWSPEEDEQLREMVLETIRSGGTQLEAFQKIGERIGRTAGACGFRWNAVLRQQDPQSYVTAKQKRVNTQIQRSRKLQIQSFSELYEQLRQVERAELEMQEQISRLSQNLEQKKVQIESLKSEQWRLSQEENHFDWIQKEVKERYQELLHIMDRLRDDSAEPRLMTDQQEASQRPRPDSSS